MSASASAWLRGLCDRILLLEGQLVPRPTGLSVKCDPSIDQDRLGGPEGSTVAVQQHRATRSRPLERMHVAQTTARHLQIGLEQEGHLAVLVQALLLGLRQFGQPPITTADPVGMRRPGQILGERGVTGQMAHAQEGGGRVQVVGGQSEGLLHVRTAWPSFSPASHTGYQSRSANGPTSTRRPCTSRTSRSLNGASSLRP